jgi:hypothetical protein
VQEFSDADAMVASALCLMTPRVTACCPRKARRVIRQRELLAEHPGEDVAPLLRQVCRKLVREWHGLLHAMQKAAPAPGASPTLH